MNNAKAIVDTKTGSMKIVPMTDDEVLAHVRSMGDSARKQRDEMLSGSDWIVAYSVERSQPIPDVWVQYRQALRDVPQQPGFPQTITWPTPPV